MKEMIFLVAEWARTPPLPFLWGMWGTFDLLEVHIGEELEWGHCLVPRSEAAVGTMIDMISAHMNKHRSTVGTCVQCAASQCPAKNVRYMKKMRVRNSTISS